MVLRLRGDGGEGAPSNSSSDQQPDSTYQVTFENKKSGTMTTRDFRFTEAPLGILALEISKFENCQPT